MVDNNIKDFGTNQDNLELSTKQKEELNSRIASFHNDPSQEQSDKIKSIFTCFYCYPLPSL